MSKLSMQKFRAAVVDGRVHNIFYRIEQLEKLHSTLKKESASLIEAIERDSDYTDDEARFEYALALNAVRSRYDELDHQKALQEEYSIANGRNASLSRIGYGAVTIQYASHSSFFSLIAPLSAAIAAGNCVIIEYPNNLKHLPKLLQTLAPFGLDPDSILSVTSPVGKSLDDLEYLTVVPEGAKGVSSGHSLVSKSQSLSVAIVDRGANFEEAARNIVAARFSYDGKSVYAPDIVLVNEFAKQEFLQAVTQQTISFESRTTISKHSGRYVSSKQKLAKSMEGRLVTEGISGAVIEVSHQQRSSFEKIRDAVLRVAPVTSLDHALNLLDSIPLLSLTFFGGKAEAKYATQAVRAQFSLVNHIPAELLVGPAYPDGFPIDLDIRYPTMLFSRPAPAFILTAPEQTSSLSAARINKLFAMALVPLRRKKRTKGLTAAFGFFEQAFLLHFGLLFFSSISILAGSGYWWLYKRQSFFGRSA